MPSLAERRITAELLHAVLDVTDSSGSQVATALGKLGALSQDAEASTLDRMVMFATVGAETFTLGDLRQTLANHQANASLTAIQESLQRLSLAYVVEKETGHYRYPVPLIRDFLLDEAEGRPEERLTQEVSDWREKT